MAPSRIKAEIELDMRWASPLDKTWRDELIVVVWSIPLLGALIPGTRPYVFDWLHQLKDLDPSLPSLFTYGWVAILAGTFGMKHIKSIFMPTRLAGLVNALGANQQVDPQDAQAAREDLSQDGLRPDEQSEAREAKD
jgi:hypothetical protein